MEGLPSILCMLRSFDVTPWEVGRFFYRSLYIYILLYRRGFENEISYGGQQLKLVNMQSYGGNPSIQLAFPYWVGEVSGTKPVSRPNLRSDGLRTGPNATNGSRLAPWSQRLRRARYQTPPHSSPVDWA